MLEVFTNLICFAMMSILGFYTIKIITKSNQKLINLKIIILLLILIIIQTSLYKIQYTGIFSIISYIVATVIYAKIFNISICESLISYGIMLLIIGTVDFIISIAILNFLSIDEIRSIWYLKIPFNILSLIGTFLIINQKKIKLNLQKFYISTRSNKILLNIIFLMLLIVSISYLLYNIETNFELNEQNIVNIIIAISCILMASIFISEKNQYSQLASEYDNLFTYVQNFEEWIEKEQLNRHEYKNQLAVLRCLVKNKKAKDKIDEILEDNINIEGKVVNQLKSLPKGGVKGLMYYKTAIAQKQKINLTIDVSLNTKTKLNKLSEKELKDLCKLIGIYFDNAIEAARETRKKIILIEVYEFDNKVKFVFSNTFKNFKNMNKRNEKGISSKGEGHGNGLYFASKIINKNDWLEQRQDIVDKYYIQELTIKK